MSCESEGKILNEVLLLNINSIIEVTEETIGDAGLCYFSDIEEEEICCVAQLMIIKYNLYATEQ